jgi:hypothetical protein
VFLGYAAGFSVREARALVQEGLLYRIPGKVAGATISIMTGKRYF